MTFSFTQWIAILAPIPFLWLFWHWYVNIAFPIQLEKQIKAGKSWVYLPLNWKGSRKSIIRFFSHTIAFFPAFTVLGSFYYSLNYGIIIASCVGTSLFLALNLLSKKLILIRYKQQESNYFSILSAIARQNKRDGKPASEVEMRNLCSWEHQNTLRLADKDGRLLQELYSQAKAKNLLGQASID